MLIRLQCYLTIPQLFTGLDLDLHFTESLDNKDQELEGEYSHGYRVQSDKRYCIKDALIEPAYGSYSNVSLCARKQCDALCSSDIKF